MASTKTTPQEKKEAKEAEERELAQRIGRNVLRVLGVPPGFHRVKVTETNYYSGHYRVDVMIKESDTVYPIIHVGPDSFFVKAVCHGVGMGEILHSDPPLVNKYTKKPKE